VAHITNCSKLLFRPLLLFHGPLGAQGAQGPRGPTGLMGPRDHGAQGVHGAHGAHGPHRAHGTTILTGTIIWVNGVNIVPSLSNLPTCSMQLSFCLGEFEARGPSSTSEVWGLWKRQPPNLPNVNYIYIYIHYVFHWPI